MDPALFTDCPEEQAHARPLARFLYRVVHDRVAVRASPSLEAQIIGVAHEDSEVVSVEEMGGWIRLAPVTTGGGQPAFMLVHGRLVGLGPLLLRIRNTASRWDWKVVRTDDGHFHLTEPPEGFAEKEAADPSAIAPLFRVGKRPLYGRHRRPGGGGAPAAGLAMVSREVRFRVVHPRVAVRAAPSLEARIIGVARGGSEVSCAEEPREGEHGAGWIRLSAASSASTQAAWMLIDGAVVELGLLLEKVVPPPEECAEEGQPDAAAV